MILSACQMTTPFVPVTIQCGAIQARRAWKAQNACHQATMYAKVSSRHGANQTKSVCKAFRTAQHAFCTAQHDAVEIRLTLSSQMVPRSRAVATALTAGVATQPHLRRRMLRASFGTSEAPVQMPTCAPPAKPITSTTRQAVINAWLRVAPTATRVACAAVSIHAMRAVTTTWTIAGCASRKSACTLCCRQGIN